MARRTKEQRREARQVKSNHAKGRKAEKAVKRKWEGQGWHMKPIRGGADFIATKDGFKDRAVEVKSGPGPHELSGQTTNHELRPAQQRMRDVFGDRYVVERWY